MTDRDRERLQLKKERYLRDPIPTRLGNLASSLARLASYAERAHRAAVLQLLRETVYFIDWTGPQVDGELQPEFSRVAIAAGEMLRSLHPQARRRARSPRELRP